MHNLRMEIVSSCSLNSQTIIIALIGSGTKDVVCRRVAQNALIAVGAGQCHTSGRCRFTVMSETLLLE